MSSAAPFGNFSTADTIGLGPIETVTLMSDGSLEPLDVLRIVGDSSTKTELSVLKDAIQAVERDARFTHIWDRISPSLVVQIDSKAASP